MIKIKNLNFTYPGAQRPILKNLSFEINRGETFGLLGPSGSGKSTTQKILMGLLRGFSGTAEVFGASIDQVSANFYQRIGVSFELPALYLRLSAKENLEMFAALYAGPTLDPIQVLEMVDLADAANTRVATFSKGMKMRLNLCRALLHNPELLFLDEPTTGQDPTRAHITHDLIRRLKSEGKTIFLTTHNMSEADELCDRVGFLFDGNIPIIGPPADLKRQYGHREIQLITQKNNQTKKTNFPMDGLGENQAFLNQLNTQNLVSLHTLEASLEEVFIQSTTAAGST